MEHVISGLVKKHSELAGKIEYHRSQIKELNDDRQSIGEAIKVLQPDFNLRDIRSKQVKPNNRFFKSREASILLLDSMREAQGPCTTIEIVGAVALKKDIDLAELNKRDRDAFKATLFTVLKRQEERGVIVKEGKAGTAYLWQLADLAGK